MLDQDLFLDALVRERKRADRFDQPFMLLLISADNRAAADASSWATVIAGLGAAKRETDVLGWVRAGRGAGIILPEVIRPTASQPRISATASATNSPRVDADTAASYSIDLHLHSGLPALGSRSWRVRARPEAALDVAGSLALLAVLSPLFLVIAAAVKLTSAGPVLFRQERVGEAASLHDAEVPHDACGRDRPFTRST